ncbi:MAG: hypothetical protein ACOVOY_05645 [Sediminibacterium sp.]|jgi:hypothetical protein|nr:hypothetical protein [Chitinophagaceae bacterium]MCA6470684.1 hypothetical protein [Chitinophagaceae bacterium]MCA6489560.1 hypothetical protein [Chitinophagaceae bacterium]MCA6495314.1 hypothetical protein [Chitinophagaceae bacterium]MCA6498675.1 hypothetical protein [Chitinophagaceae bacterium]
MKLFRWVLIVLALLAIVYPIVYLAGRVMGFPLLPMSKYYFLVIILVVGILWWEEKQNRTS